ncbi:uncharacterized protein LAESUDRAFT_526840 [Laetiporus sulphureus 93-53]|uniref:Uncharacterized protein n=1 Tax=Laetiporus sulphureus 93-53 TaxID=1314785 RepID=A0A165BD98_9APHY|nr:uncharacterized protein LAESUDRAFT_526840 [Laetiporus sulphureus 93-53]KZT00788.1 hypothetical protein LAESUDRAFT_526840 [Laetiporus sulphureus 93-53]
MSTSRSSTPRSAPPPIQLPSSDKPLPPNFLRNQQALLGLAGLVGGVNPAQLAKQRGTSAQNPIVIDDSETPVGTGPVTSQPASISRHPTRANFDTSQLPRPSNEEIIATLVRQGNVVPVIESLLRLLSGSAPTTPPPPHLHKRSGFEHIDSRAAPPLKRRKLNRVPAGATDWDVPYPFHEGQGPQDYKTNWAKDRVRELLADLVGLLRAAAKKAAAKEYQQQQEEERRRRLSVQRQGWINGHYRMKTAFYGLEKDVYTQPPSGGDGRSLRKPVLSGTSTPGARPSSEIAPIATSARQTMSEPPSQPSSLASADHPADTPLDIFDSHQVQELQTVQADQQQVVSNIANAEQSNDFASPVFSSDRTQPYFDDWLALLNSFPAGDLNDASSATDIQILLNDLGITDTTCYDLIPMSASTPDDATASTSGSSPAYTPAETPLSEPFPMLDSIPDYLIDPALFDMSASDASVLALDTLAQDVDQHGSMASKMALSDATGQPQIGSAPVTATAMNTDSPPTPTLTNMDSFVGSPRSSAEQDAEEEALTPQWTWPLGDLGEVGRSDTDVVAIGIGEEGMRLDDMGVSVEDMRAFERELEKACMPVEAPAQQVQLDVDEGRPTTQPLQEAIEDTAWFATPAQEPEEHGQAAGLSISVSGQATPPFASTNALSQLQQDNHTADTSGEMGASAATLNVETTESSTHANAQAETQKAVGNVVSSAPLHEVSLLEPTVQQQTQNLQPPFSSIPSQFQPRSLFGSQAHLYSQSYSHTLQQPHVFPTAKPTFSPTVPYTSTASASPSPYAALSSLLSLAGSLHPLGSIPSSGSISPRAGANKNLNRNSAVKGKGSGKSKAEILAKARMLRNELEKARERARVELWEVSVEQGGLVNVGKEFGKK